MKIDLTPFCASPEANRYQFERPWSRGKWTIATDGRIIVRIPRDPDVPENNLAPTAQSMFTEHFKGTSAFGPMPESPPPGVERFRIGSRLVNANEFREKYPELMKRFQGYLEARPELASFIHDPNKVGCVGRRHGAILDESKLRRVLARMLDENEFLSPFGIRSLSRHHREHPYVVRVGEQEYGVGYVPAESDSGMFGGNSNWRGPIWVPVNALIIRALLQYYGYFGNDFTVECPTGSGRRMTLYQVAEEITRRLASMFLRDQDGHRPVNGGARKFQDDPHWHDCIQFYEYFHGDNGAGLGASHQTGWTGVIASALHLFATVTPEQLLKDGLGGIFESIAGARAGSPS